MVVISFVSGDDRYQAVFRRRPSDEKLEMGSAIAFTFVGAKLFIRDKDGHVRAAASKTMVGLMARRMGDGEELPNIQFPPKPLPDLTPIVPKPPLNP